MSTTTRRSKLQGVCTKWMDGKGYGFIRGEDDQSYFCHQTQIAVAHGFRKLQEGEDVEFEPKIDNGKVQATNVTGPRGTYLKGGDPKNATGKSNKFKKPCFDHQKGKCYRGASCRYSHDRDASPQSSGTKGPSPTQSARGYGDTSRGYRQHHSYENGSAYQNPHAHSDQGHAGSPVHPQYRRPTTAGGVAPPTANGHAASYAGAYPHLTHVTPTAGAPHPPSMGALSHAGGAWSLSSSVNGSPTITGAPLTAHHQRGPVAGAATTAHQSGAWAAYSGAPYSLEHRPSPYYMGYSASTQPQTYYPYPQYGLMSGWRVPPSRPTDGAQPVGNGAHTGYQGYNAGKRGAAAATYPADPYSTRSTGSSGGPQAGQSGAEMHAGTSRGVRLYATGGRVDE